jgi:hypothetical protein
MQGEKIGEETGKVTSQRVLPNPGGSPKMETSFESAGSILGVNHKTIGTYWAVLRPDGTVFGEGQGIVMSGEGDMASWVGQGVGRVKPDGAVSYRGALYYQTSAERWSRLNSVAAIFEYEVAGDGSSTAQIWEWK